MAAFDAIRSVAGDGEKQNSRQKLRQSDQAEIERAFCDLVDLPSHGDSLHLDRSHDQKTRDLEQRERRMREGGASGSGVGGCRHEPLLCHRRALRA